MLGPILNGVLTGTDTFTYDTFSASQNIVVEVGCESRKISVRGFLQDDLEFGIDSKWDTIMGGSGSALPADLINLVDVASQAFGATSVRQPWFSRAVWRGNGPLRVPVTMNFMAQEDAKKEVWEPIWNLVRLCLPQLEGKGTIANFENLAGESLGMSKKDIALLQKFIGTYKVPGPSLFYPINEEGSDVMYFKMGKLQELSLDACYFTDLKFTIPPVFSGDSTVNGVSAGGGFPTFASASFTVNSIDSMYMDANGNIRNLSINKEEVQGLVASMKKSQEEFTKKSDALFRALRGQ